MQGELTDSVTLGPLGINGDRHHAVRDVATGKVLSAKHPKHGKILLSFSAVFDEMTKNVSVVSPDGDNFDADDPTLARVLSEALSTEVVIDGASADSDVYESYWPPIEGLALSDTNADFAVAMMTNKGSFVDLAALHLLTDSSIRLLSRLAPNSDISPQRFRPGVLLTVSGTDEETNDKSPSGSADRFIENDWAPRKARLGETTIAFSLATPRCIMTTLGQGDLPRDLGVLQALAKHNRIDFPGMGAFACLGAYAEVTRGGRVSVGDTLTFLAE